MTRNPSDVFRDHQVVAFDAIAEPYRDLPETREYRPLRIEQLRELLRLAARVAVATEYEGSMDRDELQTLHDAASEAEHWADIRD